MRLNIILFTSVLLAACASVVNKSQKGMLFDATMNTATIITPQSDTLSFSTMNADRRQAQGLLLNDTLQVFYKGKYRQGMAATKLILFPNHKYE